MSEIIVKPIVASPVAPPQVIVVEKPEKTEAEKAADEVLNRPAEEKEEGKDLIPTDHYLTSPLFHEIANYFNIESSEYDSVKDKLSVITDYIINKEGSNKLEDVMMSIRKMEDNMQPPSWWEKRYNNLYRYVRLATQRDSVDKAMNSLERNVKYV